MGRRRERAGGGAPCASGRTRGVRLVLLLAICGLSRATRRAASRSHFTTRPSGAGLPRFSSLACVPLARAQGGEPAGGKNMPLTEVLSLVRPAFWAIRRSLVCCVALLASPKTNKHCRASAPLGAKCSFLFSDRTMKCPTPRRLLDVLARLRYGRPAFLRKSAPVALGVSGGSSL